MVRVGCARAIALAVAVLWPALASGQGSFTLAVAPSTLDVCAPSNAVYTVDVGSVDRFSEPVVLNVSGEPSGSTASFALNPVTPPGSTTLTIGNTGAASPGTYALSLDGTSSPSSFVQFASATLHLANAPPGPAALALPPDGASNLPLDVELGWSGGSQAAAWDVELAEDSRFTIGLQTWAVTTPAVAVTGLAPNTTYFWRVRPSNACGQSAFSNTFSFTTGTDPGGTPADFALAVSPDALDVCTPSDAVYTVDVASIGGFFENVTLAAGGAPAGTTVSFSQNPVVPSFSSTLTVGNTGAAAPGTYTLSLDGTSSPSSFVRFASAVLHLADAPPGPAAPALPPDGASNLPLDVELSWSGGSQAAAWDVELAQDAGFTTGLQTWAVTTPTLAVTGLAPTTTYFWRVRPSNACGQSAFSSAFSFTTGTDPGGTPADFALGVSPDSLDVCTPGDAVYTVDVASIGGFFESVTLAASGEPAGATVSFSQNPVVPSFSSTLTVGNTGDLVPGAYTLSLDGTSSPSSFVRFASTVLHLADAPPGPASLALPPNGASDLPLDVDLGWSGGSQAAAWDVELAEDAGFTVGLQTWAVTTPALAVTGLAPNTTYFWRVRPSNACGQSTFSSAFSFATGAGSPAVPAIAPLGRAALAGIVLAAGLWLGGRRSRDVSD